MSRDLEQGRAGDSRTPSASGLRGLLDFDAMEKRIMGVPARIMLPRLVFIGAVVALVAFGLVMVFSASSIKGLLSDSEDPSGFLVRQLAAMVPGMFLLLVTACTDYHRWATGRLFTGVWAVTFAVLFAVFGLGVASHGAMRWIPLGPLTIQPSELAKATVIVACANSCQRFFVEGEWDLREFAVRFFLSVFVLVGLILVQPDKGTTMVLGLTIFCMLWVCDVPHGPLLTGLGVCVLVFFALSFADEYSRQRLLVMLNPEGDPYGAGYQLVQGFYAFGSGGLFGVGLGLGRQKYSYLPEMHNDFIFAVIGEELGVVGCVAVLALFAVLLWAGLKIAGRAPDLLGRLIALGGTMLIVFSVLLNICGVIGLFPMSGKTIPFISYGGSAMMGALLVVGMVISVSRASALPETEHDRARRGFSLAPEPAGERPAVEGSTAGPARPRSFRLVPEQPAGQSARGERAASRGEGPARRRATARAGNGAARSGRPDRRSTSVEGRREAERLGREHPDARITRDSRGRERIDLGRSGAERLRPQKGPEVRDRTNGSGRRSQRR